MHAGIDDVILQEDKCTPVHLACSQGSLDMLKLMFEIQPEKKDKCIEALNDEGMTPLHAAVNFNRVNVVKYLLGEVCIDIPAVLDGQRPAR